MGCLNRLDEPVFMAVSKPMLTEFDIHLGELWSQSHEDNLVITFQAVTTMSHKMQNRPSVASKSKVGGGEKKTKRRMSKAPSEDLNDIPENNETANKTQGKKGTQSNESIWNAIGRHRRNGG